MSCAGEPDSAPSSSTVLLLCGIFAFRLLNAISIQTQFDPDEYWQTLEVAQCLIYGNKGVSTEQTDVACTYTWEWTREHGVLKEESNSIMHAIHKNVHYALTGPIRTFVNVLPTATLYYFLSNFDSYLTPNLAQFLFSKGPIIINALMFIAPIDWCIFVLTRHIYDKEIAGWAVFTSLTSWFMAYGMIRTYSNSIEAALTIYGITILRYDLFFKTKKPPNMILARTAFILGGICVSIRFSSLASWLPIGVFFVIRRNSMNEKPLDALYFFRQILSPCALYGMIGLVISSFVDRLIYGFWIMPVLGAFSFNILEGNGVLYGTQPWYWYILAGLPAILGTVLPVTILGFTRWYPNDNQAKHQVVLLSIVGVYTLLHSISAHKEMRFLLPVLPLSCVISAPYCHSLFRDWQTCIVEGKPQKTSKHSQKRRLVFISLIALPNALAFCFFGLIHQRSPLEINAEIVRQLQTSPQINKMPSENAVLVHYLTDCHATPLYSYLHTGSLNVHLLAQTLDCSPTCRANVTYECESDAFLRNPLQFVKDAYGPAVTSITPITGKKVNSCLDSCPDLHFSSKSSLEHEVTETGKFHVIPQFVVVFESEASKIHGFLTDELGLNNVAQYKHKLVGLEICLDAIKQFLVPSFRSSCSLITLNFEHLMLYKSVQ